MAAILGFLVTSIIGIMFFVYAFVKTVTKALAGSSAFLLLVFLDFKWMHGPIFLFIWLFFLFLIDYVLTSKILADGLFNKNKMPIICFIYGLLLLLIISPVISVIFKEILRMTGLIESNPSIDFYWPSLYISIPICILYVFFSLKSID